MDSSPVSASRPLAENENKSSCEKRESPEMESGKDKTANSPVQSGSGTVCLDNQSVNWQCVFGCYARGMERMLTQHLSSAIGLPFWLLTVLWVLCRSQWKCPNW